MKILIATSEVGPYSKTGGLADMVGALGKYLAQGDHEVVVVSPYYRCVAEAFPEVELLDWDIHVPLGHTWVHGRVRRLQVTEKLQYLFIQEPSFFDRHGLYQVDGEVFRDNAERFIFFSKAVVHLARYLPFKPDVIHAHDWQTGLVPLLVKHQSVFEGWDNRPATVFTIHNLAYQGTFPTAFYANTNLPEDYLSPSGLEFFGDFNCLKSGIVYADFLTTVSPKYAAEILTEAYGCGLQGVLAERSSVLAGVLNGVDYEEWNTENNPRLMTTYSVGNLRGKGTIKASLQKELGLTVRASTPLFGNISRLTDQKGSDLILEAIPQALAQGAQFVLLGSGDPELEAGFQSLAEAWPGAVAVRIGYDPDLAHRIEAGCDFFLMPSRFEPCGLNQLYSLRYGTVPVVRRTGGLDDTINDSRDMASQEGDGLKFDEATGPALAGAIKRALELFKSKKMLNACRRRGMEKDFSWKATSGQYHAVYQKAIKAVRGVDRVN